MRITVFDDAVVAAGVDCASPVEMPLTSVTVPTSAIVDRKRVFMGQIAPVFESFNTT